MAEPNRLVRLAAGTLLLAQKNAKRFVTRVVADHAASVASEAERRHDRERKAAILALLLMGAKSMAVDIAAALVLARGETRGSARQRLAAEMKAAGVTIGAHQWVLGHRADEDAASAQSAAESLASQWQGLAVATVLAGLRKDVQPTKSIRSTVSRMDARIQRTTSTEVAQAYNDEHRDALLDLIAHDEQFRDGEWAASVRDDLMEQWSAMLDACPVCFEHDGEIVPIGEPFSSGDEPAYMHPHCACLRVLVPSAESARIAA
jgi:hypothetical protein